MNLQFIYVMDPMCSWCWAFSPVTAQLKSNFPHIPWQYVMGGLAPDSDQPMPAEMQEKIQAIWQHIEASTGSTFNHAFWQQNTPRRSTYPACRAVISSEALRSGSSADMVLAIQQAYYQHAQNPSDNEVLIALADKLGLDKNAFAQRLDSADTEQQLQQHLQQSMALGAQGFPSLFINVGDQITPLSYGYTNADAITARLHKLGLAGQ